MSEPLQAAESPASHGHPDRGLKRYTATARQLLTLAPREAQQRQHAYVGAEHLLWALVHHGQSNAAQVLVALGVNLAEVGTSIDFVIGPGQGASEGDRAYTPRLTAALALAAEEARRRNQALIGTEDLLLGLMREGTNVAASLLDKFGLTYQVIARHLDRAGGADRERDAAQGLKGQVLTCRITDGDLAVIDAFVEAGIQPTRSAAAAWLIQAGIAANRPLVDKVHHALTEIRRLREELRTSPPAPTPER